MKLFTAILLSAASVALVAAEMKCDCTTAAGTKSICVNQWDGFKPFPKYGFDAESKSFKVEKSQKGFGFCFYGRSLAAKAGDKVTITVTAKGTGTIYLGIQCSGEKGWSGMDERKPVTLSSEWKTYTVEVTVHDLNKKKTVSVFCDLMGNKDTELWLKDYNAVVSAPAAK